MMAATAVHAGFQLTVTSVVYPALGAVSAHAWARTHEVHSRRIVPVVGLVYSAVAITSIGQVSSDLRAASVLSAGASLVVLGLTAGLAAPLHRRLSSGRDPALIRRLIWVDRLRTLFALLSLAAAIHTVGR